MEELGDSTDLGSVDSEVALTSRQTLVHLPARRDCPVGVDRSASPIHKFQVGLHLDGAPLLETFVDRPEQMAQLQKALLPVTKYEGRRCSFLHGLGGVGKTSLSAAFARRHHEEYSSVFWLDGSNEQCLKRSIAALARIIPDKSYLESRRSFSQSKEQLELDKDLVLDWLAIADNNSWLLIIDNLGTDTQSEQASGEVFDIELYLPKADHGHILINAREPQKHRELIELGMMDAHQSRSHFLERSGILSSENVPELNELLDLLGGNPIGVALAGSFIKETQLSLASYLRIYNDITKQATKSDDGASFPLAGVLHSSILVTVTLTCNHLRSHNETAAGFLRLWTYLYHGDIWFDLFSPQFPLPMEAESLSWFCSTMAREQDFVQVMSVLRAYSMIQEKVNSPAYCMHSLIHQCATHVSGNPNDPEMAWLAVRTIGRATSADSSSTDRLLEQRLQPHATCSHHLVASKAAEPYLTLRNPFLPEELRLDTTLIYLSATFRLGKHFIHVGKLTEAGGLIRRAYEGYHEILGAEHAATTDADNIQAEILAHQGRTSEAEEAYLRVLEIYNKQLGPDNFLTWSTANALADLYSKEGKLAHAGEMMRLVLAALENTRGPEHRSTIHIVTKLGVLYSVEGKLDEAGEMYQRALPVQKKMQTIELFLLLESIQNLASAYVGFKEAAKAEKMALIAYHEYKELAPTVVSKAVDVVSSVGTLYQEQGKLEQAERMYRCALDGYEQDPSGKLVQITNLAYNLASVFLFQEKLEDAETMLRKSLEGYTKTLGPDHSYTFDAMNNLAAVLDRQHRPVEAEQLYLQSLESKERSLGRDHQSTLDSRSNLGAFYAGQNEFAKAETMYLQVLEVSESKEPRDDSLALGVLNNLGVLYLRQEKRREAEKYYVRALDVYNKILSHRASTSHVTENDDDQVRLFKLDGTAQGVYIQPTEEWNQRLSILNPGHTWALNALEDLAGKCMETHEFRDAENLYLRLLKAKDIAFGRAHPSTLDAALTVCTTLFYRCKLEPPENIEGGNEITEDVFSTNDFLTDINPTRRLIWLSENYGLSYTFIFGYLGKAFLQHTDYKNARPALRYEVAFSMDGADTSGVSCDKCENSITPKTGRFVCEVCEQVDFCSTCFSSWKNGGWVKSSCLGHTFFEVYRVAGGESAVPEPEFELWMQGLRAAYGIAGAVE